MKHAQQWQQVSLSGSAQENLIEASKYVPEQDGLGWSAQARPGLGRCTCVPSILDLQDLIGLVDDPVGTIHGHLPSPASSIHLHNMNCQPISR